MSSPSSALEDPFGLTGTVLEGQYRTDEIIGEGGFGVVYRGRHLSLDQPIAIKVLKGLDGGDPTINSLILEKFRAEARLLYTLSQSSLHIVRALDFGAATTPSGAWAPFMILEWLDGRSLADDLLDRRNRGMRGRTVAEALAILEPVADGLSVAHQKQVAHRDVKPANIFLLGGAPKAKPGQVKVLDFGIAKIMKEGEAAGTKGTFSSFTWLYATPEQLDPRIGPTGLATDVYGVGLILTELLTDKKPVDEHDVVGILKAATNPTYRPTPRARGANIPDELEAICQRALAVDPRHRYASVTDLWAALALVQKDGSSTMFQPASSQNPQSSSRGSNNPPAFGPPPPLAGVTVTSAMPSVGTFGPPTSNPLAARPSTTTPNPIQSVRSPIGVMNVAVPASQVAPSAMLPPTSPAPANHPMAANPMAQTDMASGYMAHGAMPPSMMAPSSPMPAAASQMQSGASPPRGTHPPGFTQPTPGQQPQTAPVAAPLVAPPMGYPPSPPLNVPPPGGALRPMPNQSGTNFVAIIAIVLFIFGLLFAGSCALLHGALHSCELGISAGQLRG